MNETQADRTVLSAAVVLIAILVAVFGLGFIAGQISQLPGLRLAAAIVAVIVAYLCGRHMTPSVVVHTPSDTAIDTHA